MAHIKCRYSNPYCLYHGRNERQYHSDFWGCDSNDLCDIGKYTKPITADCVNPTCIYCEYRLGEFEKTINNYNYYDGELKIGRNTYMSDEIDYLEIDGRVLVEGIT